MRLDARGGIARARGLESADPPQQSRKRQLVHANQENEGPGEHDLLGSRRTMIRCGLARKRFSGTPVEGRANREPFFSHLGRAELVRSYAGNDDEVHPVRKEIGPCPETLPAHPLDAVPPDCRADLATDHHAHPRHPRDGLGFSDGLLCHEQREVLRCNPATRALRFNELDVPAQPSALPEGERRRDYRARRHTRHRSTRPRLFLVDPRHEALPALASPVREDLAAPGRGHSCAKAVRPRAANVVRLIGTLHRELAFREPWRGKLSIGGGAGQATGLPPTELRVL